MTPALVRAACHIDTCDLDHVAGGDTSEPETPFRVHTSALEWGAIWENMDTGDIFRRVDFGPDHDPTPTQLRDAADWLEDA